MSLQVKLCVNVLQGVASGKSNYATLQVGCDWGGRGDCGGVDAALWDCALPITSLKCTPPRPDTKPSPVVMKMEGFQDSITNF